MYKKIIFFVLFAFSFYHTDCSYMNGQDITFKTILTGDCCTSVDYNILNDGAGNIGGAKRVYGIHNMSIEIPGYEVVHLVKDDVCLHPNLFTMLNVFLSDNNFLVQRWACVKWHLPAPFNFRQLPLSFGFQVQNDTLTVYSSIWKYRFLAPFRAKKVISLTKTAAWNAKQNATIKVSVNGRSVVVEAKTIVQIYSASALNFYAMLARMLFL